MFREQQCHLHIRTKRIKNRNCYLPNKNLQTKIILPETHKLYSDIFYNVRIKL